MATTTTFTTLIQDLVRFCEEGAVDSSTVAAQLPRLVNNSERTLARKLKIQGYQKVVVSAFDLSGVVAKPAGWLSTVSFNWGNGTGNKTRNFIYPRSYEYCTMYWPDRSVTGNPKFYADYDLDHWLIVPTPAVQSPFEVLTYLQPPLLDDANQTNWVTEIIPELLLYQTLSDLEAFLKEDERVAGWKQRRDELLADITGQDIQKIVDRATTRSGA